MMFLGYINDANNVVNETNFMLREKNWSVDSVKGIAPQFCE